MRGDSSHSCSTASVWPLHRPSPAASAPRAVARTKCNRAKNTSGCSVAAAASSPFTRRSCTPLAALRTRLSAWPMLPAGQERREAGEAAVNAALRRRRRWTLQRQRSKRLICSVRPSGLTDIAGGEQHELIELLCALGLWQSG